jgi:hypothetical protein
VGCELHGMWCAEPCSCARCRTLWIVNANAISKKLWRYDVEFASTAASTARQVLLCQQSVGVEEPNAKPRSAAAPRCDDLSIPGQTTCITTCSM